MLFDMLHLLVTYVAVVQSFREAGMGEAQLACRGQPASREEQAGQQQHHAGGTAQTARRAQSATCQALLLLLALVCPAHRLTGGQCEQQACIDTEAAVMADNRDALKD
jgi:hypothetical protein